MRPKNEACIVLQDIILYSHIVARLSSFAVVEMQHMYMQKIYGTLGEFGESSLWKAADLWTTKLSNDPFLDRFVTGDK